MVIVKGSEESTEGCVSDQSQAVGQNSNKVIQNFQHFNGDWWYTYF